MTHDPKEVARQLRKAALESTAEQLGLCVGAAEPFGALMEIGFPCSAATLTTFLDGTASLYFSSGGGLLGGGLHDGVRKAATRFVALSGRFIDWAEKADHFPLPQDGMVCFHILLKGSVLVREEPDGTLKNGLSPLTKLYLAGHEVLTQLRLCEQHKQP
jgi:hypothetical protein